MDYLNAFYELYTNLLHLIYNFLNSLANNQFGYFIIYANVSFNFLFCIYQLIYFISHLISSRSGSSSNKKSDKEDKNNKFKQKKDNNSDDDNSQ